MYEVHIYVHIHIYIIIWCNSSKHVKHKSQHKCPGHLKTFFERFLSSKMGREVLAVTAATSLAMKNYPPKKNYPLDKNDFGGWGQECPKNDFYSCFFQEWVQEWFTFLGFFQEWFSFFCVLTIQKKRFAKKKGIENMIINHISVQ